MDIPVLIKNYVGASGGTPNTKEDDITGWKLVRRFTIVDKLSGIS